MCAAWSERCAAWRERDVALLETGDFIFAGGSWGLSRLPTGARRFSSTRMVEDAAFAALCPEAARERFFVVRFAALRRVVERPDESALCR